MIIGPFINAGAIVFGGLIGAALGGRVPERLRTNLTMLFGLCSMCMGIVMIAKVAQMPAMILALLLGTILGELILLEQGINKLASKTKTIVEKILPNNQKKGVSHEEFLQKFVGIVILFSFSGTGIFGSMNEGLTGDSSILIVKAFLDFFTAIIFGTTLGSTIATAAIPQTVLQIALAYSAVLIIPLITPEMRADFAAAGGMLMVATGFRICGILHFQVANMLPALFIIMPISAIWLQMMG
ncbi:MULTISPECIES: DUF554 domain-containing protein [Basfia]|uniref:DUF554 domain-containing protein n=2 Tax=Basfia TaxID=697331 RepID=Q65V91_MANSM|nr:MULTISPECIES: DUF554 domain-containing protein [Basfia]AAU37119.1 unknown [[Mannheimia] succiniciproducens MBEL55E]QIM67970.1 hypothetical protein A4G13_00440 [Basfia succiniciproducens]SCY14086.1 hypothetical protein SAMN02910354_01629 [Basfia succiniciproducens]SEQ46942.1 hypothetical protein SAMN02910415_01505 [Basfia succiniciproducens]